MSRPQPIDLTDESSSIPPEPRRNNAFLTMIDSSRAAANRIVESLSPEIPILKVSRRRWEEAIERLKKGHMYRGQGSGPMIVNERGCWLPAKTNVNNSGYTQINPAPARGPAEVEEKVIAPQLAHRVSLWLNSSPETAGNIKNKRMAASHRCNEKRCFNPNHLTWETKESNEARKVCSTQVDVMFYHNGQRFILRARGCPHDPVCIPRIEERELEKYQVEQ